MPVGDLHVLEALPCAVPGVARHLIRTHGGQIVEAVTLPEGRLEQLPRGGVFAAVSVAAGCVLLGPPLKRSLVELQPPPLAILGLFSRLLDDLDALHRDGGAHGALALEGFGIEEGGTFRVRPVFHQAGELSASGDVRALGQALAALASAERLVAAGVARAPFLCSGLALDGGRLGFLDGRAARQAFAVACRGLPIHAEAAAFLAGVGARLPPAPPPFRTRPVSVAPPPDRAARTADARAWLDRSLDDARSERFDRERGLAAEAERLAASLAASTAATLTAARAVAEHEAQQIARRTVSAAPAAFFVGAGQRADAAEEAPASPRLRLSPAPRRAEAQPAPEDDAEDVLDAESAEGVSMSGFATAEVFISPERLEARAAQVQEARRLEEEAARVAEAEADAQRRRVDEEEAGEVAAQHAEAAVERAAKGRTATRPAARAEAERAAEAQRAAARAAVERDVAERAAAEQAAVEQAAVEAERAAAEQAVEAAERAAAERAAQEAAERAAQEAAEAAQEAAEAAERAAAEQAAAAEAAERAAQEAAAAAERAAAERAAAEAAEAADRAAAERAAQEAAAAAEAAEERASVEAHRAATEAAARPPPAEDDDDDDDGPSATPRWEGLGGVRGDESRMHEKGPGKWKLQGRSREELAGQLPPGESRPMDLASPAPGSGAPWWLWGGFALMGFAGLAWWATT